MNGDDKIELLSVGLELMFAKEERTKFILEYPAM